MGDDIKRFVKFLAVCKNPKILRIALERAPDKVIKVIANAALNALQGEIPLSEVLKKKFRAKRKLFNILTTRKTSLKNKRRAILQKGGAIGLIPLILTAVLSTVGSALIRPRQ